MATIINAVNVNLGSQLPTVDFRMPAKGYAFNQLLRGTFKPGIYKGLEMSIVSGNNISISPGTYFLNGEDVTRLLDNISIKIQNRTAIPVTVNQTTPGVNEIVYIVYDYLEQVQDWASFIHDSSTAFFAARPANAIVIGEITYDGGGNITGFDYKHRDHGSITDNDISYNEGITYFDSVLKKDTIVPSGATALAIESLDLTYADLDLTNGDLIILSNDDYQAQIEQTNNTITDLVNNTLPTYQLRSEKNSSGGYVGLTGFNINLKNILGTITSFFTTSATAIRTWTFPDKDGTVAMIDDVASAIVVPGFNSIKLNINGTTLEALPGTCSVNTSGFSNTVINTTFTAFDQSSATPRKNAVYYVATNGTSFKIRLNVGTLITNRTLTSLSVTSNVATAVLSAAYTFTAGTVAQSTTGDFKGFFLLYSDVGLTTLASGSLSTVYFGCNATDGAKTTTALDLYPNITTYHGSDGVTPVNQYAVSGGAERFTPNPAVNTSAGNCYYLDANGNQSGSATAYRIIGITKTDSSANWTKVYSYGNGSEKNDNFLMLGGSSTRGSTNTQVRIFDNITVADGNDYMYVKSATLGDSITGIKFRPEFSNEVFCSSAAGFISTSSITKNEIAISAGSRDDQATPSNYYCYVYNGATGTSITSVSPQVIQNVLSTDVFRMVTNAQNGTTNSIRLQMRKVDL